MWEFKVEANKLNYINSLKNHAYIRCEKYDNLIIEDIIKL